MKLSSPLMAIIFSFILANINRSCEAIRCYKCTILTPPPFTNEIHRICSYFDYSEKFIVECPYSTFCMKKTFSVQLQNVINGTERDCAPQRNDYQVYRGNKWETETRVEEPYEEGCIEIDDKGQRISKPTRCYCKGDLCNGHLSIKESKFLKGLLYNTCYIIFLYKLYQRFW